MNFRITSISTNKNERMPVPDKRYAKVQSGEKVD